MELLVDKRFSVGTARLEGDIVATIREWALAYPNELVALDQKVKALRREYREAAGGGWTPGKTRMHVAEIPTSLAAMMVRKYGASWSNPEEEPLVWKLFKRNFTVGMIRR